MSRIKKIVFALAVCFMACFSIAATQPTTVFAANDDEVDIFNVEIKNGSLYVPGADNDTTKGTANVMNKVLDRARLLVSGITGVVTVAMIGLGVMKCFELARSSGNPNARANCIQSLIFFFIAAACCGAVSLLTGMAYNLIR